MVVGTVIWIKGVRSYPYLIPGLGWITLLDSLCKIQMSKEARDFGLHQWRMILLAAILTGISSFLLILDGFPGPQATKILTGCTLLLEGTRDTLIMVGLSTVFAYLIGLPVGLILRMTDRDGIHPIGWLNRTLGIIVNALRSIPFIILMVAMLPVAKAIVGTSLGNRAVIVTLVIAAAPYVARMVESAAKEVDAGVIEAALSMGASTLRIIWKVIIPEAKPALITGAVISTVTILGYSAMAGTIGGGGLGQIAITYGYQKYDDQIVWLCVALTIIIVQILQEFGMYIARRTDRRSRT